MLDWATRQSNMVLTKPLSLSPGTPQNVFTPILLGVCLIQAVSFTFVENMIVFLYKLEQREDKKVHTVIDGLPCEVTMHRETITFVKRRPPNTTNYLIRLKY